MTLTKRRQRGSRADLILIGSRVIGSIAPQMDGSGWSWCRHDNDGRGPITSGTARNEPQALAALRAVFEAEKEMSHV